jgi:hypothetical protein
MVKFLRDPDASFPGGGVLPSYTDPYQKPFRFADAAGSFEISRSLFLAFRPGR